MDKKSKSQLLTIRNVQESGVYKHVSFEEESMVLTVPVDNQVDQFGIDTEELIPGRKLILKRIGTIVSNMKLVQKTCISMTAI